MVTGLVALSVLAGVAGPASVQAQQAPAPSDRARVFALLRSAGVVVSAQAETALLGSDEDVRRFLTEALPLAQESDDRIAAQRMLSTGGPSTRDAANRALSGSITDVRAFLVTGWKAPWREDLRIQVQRLLNSAAGPTVRQFANDALNGGETELLAFLETRWQFARNDDDRIAAQRILNTGGPAVKRTANLALSGSIEDVREFLATGHAVAMQRDQEITSVAQLATAAQNASARADAFRQTAEDEAGKAVTAAENAKRAAQTAAEETRQAKGSAIVAAAAASRAADAANRAADAAQVAIDAIGQAISAAGEAANAASQAAWAASKAGDAASRAREAAANVSAGRAPAEQAATAAKSAAEAARGAKDVTNAIVQAILAAQRLSKIADSLTSVSDNVTAASNAAGEAEQWAGQSGVAAGAARSAAARAQRNATEAARAAGVARSLATEAADQAEKARQASVDAAVHAGNAAAAADEAARQAGQANEAAARAQAAADAARQASDTARNAADQAAKTAEIARKADSERLTANTNQAVRDAQDALQAETDALRTQVKQWEAGKVYRPDTDTQGLLDKARSAGADGVPDGRKAALRLWRSAGPYTSDAAGSALSGDAAAVTAFVTSGLDAALRQDDRLGAKILGGNATGASAVVAAFNAVTGTDEQATEFLRTGAYKGKDDEDRIAAQRILNTGGPATRAAANTALSGSIEDVRNFLAEGRYQAARDDDRIAAQWLVNSGGPEVKAAAQASLSGPGSHVRDFLRVGQHKAAQRDAENAHHVAIVNGYVAAAGQAAATASQHAANSAQSAATARGAAAEADRWSDEARNSAARAKVYADQAAAAAEQASGSAARAAQSARTAQAAAATTRGYADAANRSAAQAGLSAVQASKSAGEARESSDRAQVDAQAIGKAYDQALLARYEAEWALAEKKDLAGARNDMRDSKAAITKLRDNVEHALKNTGLPDETRRQLEETLGKLTHLLDLLGKGASADLNVVKSALADIVAFGAQSRITLPDYPEAIPDEVRKADVGVRKEWLYQRWLTLRDAPNQAEKAARFGAAYCTEFINDGACSAEVASLGEYAFEVALLLFPYGRLAKWVGETGYTALAARGAFGKALQEAALSSKFLPGVPVGSRALAVLPAVERANSRAAACLPGNSFTEGTRVLMADGSAKEIERVDVGDVVAATDPETGVTGTRRVTTTIVGTGVKHLVDIVVATDGHGGTAVITATDNHPIWVDDRHAWIGAGQLTAGDQLRDHDGGGHTVRKVVPRTEVATVRNLGVADVHTYYVLAGDTTVLVHNEGCQTWPNLMKNSLDQELAFADRLGVKPAAPGTAAFDAALSTGETVKWAVRLDGSLVIVPKNVVGAGEISHTVLTRGESVLAAGEASIVGSADAGYFGLEITRHSGHFQPGPETLQIGLDAFAAAGVKF
ncbi:hypothetical protein APASM_3857 [Actinosynnema pretiosum subsp. pretiosum]|nr:hypothetical protein APASM_3857 [Actinosynnema pretiosum subsp. pretiosum]